MNSIYETMMQNDKIVQNLLNKGINVKLFTRHSIRNSHDNVDFYEELTREGKVMAEAFGRGFIDTTLNYIVTSSSPRCIQTSENIIKGSLQNLSFIKENGLVGTWITDREQWNNSYKNIYKKNIKEILQDMIDYKDISGAYKINETINIILELLFSKYNDKEKNGVLDIFVTHDAFIMLLVCYVLKKNLNEIEWVYMLEGCFLWEENKKIYLLWRGETYEVNIL